MDTLKLCPGPLVPCGAHARNLLKCFKTKPVLAMRPQTADIGLLGVRDKLHKLWKGDALRPVKIMQSKLHSRGLLQPWAAPRMSNVFSLCLLHQPKTAGEGDVEGQKAFSHLPKMVCGLWPLKCHSMIKCSAESIWSEGEPTQIRYFQSKKWRIIGVAHDFAPKSNLYH